MRFTETMLTGAFIVDPEEYADSRSFLARTFCAQEFETHQLKTPIAQCSVAFSRKKGTVRGMYYMVLPVTEAKLVRCTRGAIHDVIVDLRPESLTYMTHITVKLTADNRRTLYVPERFAHGYQTLTDDTEVTFQTSEFYTPDDERGLRYNDPALNISWPLPVSVISAKDMAWPTLATSVEVS